MYQQGTLDNNMSMSQHVSSMAKSAWHHLHRISKIRKFLSSSSIETLINAFIYSHLNCFNSLLFGLPDYELNKLQRIQNSAARLFTGCRKFDHITPTLI